MAQYMTEKEILTLVSAGAVKAAQATVSVLPACAELVHSIGIDRFTVGLHGYTQK